MRAITRLNQSLLIKIGNIFNTFLPIRNKLVYSYSIEICASGFNELFESVFCILVAVEAFSLQKVVNIVEGVAVSWREVRLLWKMKQIIQLLKCWLCDIWSGIITGKNWTLTVDQCWLQALQLSEHLVDLLSILHCNGFTGIQKNYSG